MKLVDTSVAVDFLHGRSEAVEFLEGLVAADEVVAASDVTRFELLAGARPQELEALERFFSALSWLPVDETIARAAGELARKYGRVHGGIDSVDYLLAATASLLGADLVTTNVRHFPMIAVLQPPYHG